MSAINSFGIVGEDAFWVTVVDCVLGYQRSVPELAEKFARYDLFVDEFPLSCLNAVAEQPADGRPGRSGECVMHRWVIAKSDQSPAIRLSMGRRTSRLAAALGSPQIAIAGSGG